MAHFGQRQQYPIIDETPISNIQWINPFAQTPSNCSLDVTSTYTSINDQCLSYDADKHRSLSISSDGSSKSQVDLDPHTLQASEGRIGEGIMSNRRRRSSVLVEIEAEEPRPKKKRGKNKANAYIASNLAYIKGTSYTSRYPQPAWFNVPEGKTIVHPPPFAFPGPQSQPVSTAPPVLKQELALDPFAPPIPPSLGVATRKGSIGKKATKRASLPFDSDETKEKMPLAAVSARKDVQRAVSLERRHSVHTSSSLCNGINDLSMGGQILGALPRTDSPSLWLTPATPTDSMPISAAAPVDAPAYPHTSYTGCMTDLNPDTLPPDPTSVFPLDPSFLTQALSSSITPAHPAIMQSTGQAVRSTIVPIYVPPPPTQSFTMSDKPAPVFGLASAPEFISTSNTSLQVPPTSQVPQTHVTRASSPLIRRWSSPNIHLAALPSASPADISQAGLCHQPAASHQAQVTTSNQISETHMPPPPIPYLAPSSGTKHESVSAEPPLLWTAKQGHIIPPVAANTKPPPPLFTSEPLSLASSKVSAAEMALGLDPSAFRPVVFDGSRLFGSPGINDPFLAAFGAPFFPIAGDQHVPVDLHVAKADPVKDSTLLAPRAVPILSPYTDYPANPIGKSSTQSYKRRPRSTTPLHPLGFPRYGEHYETYQGQ